MHKSSTPPARGQLVRVRTRTYLVEETEPSTHGTVVRLACVEDFAQGEELEVVWEVEQDGKIIDEENWKKLGEKGFDEARRFSAFLHALRWNCVTATDPRLFQAPFRAGIRMDAYQLEPLRKALLLPRVNLFIADDVGLGKTIEAGLIASELLLRRRVRNIVVACPPSMLLQWKDELDHRFGLTFQILDRAYLERVRAERGYGVNPWTTHPRFLVSHRLLIDGTYTTPMFDWLGTFLPSSLLIVDEAHHAAPASGAKYAIDSKFTRAIREIAARFEHRLFLSATPHNGHSNSFSALLEILDPQRFTRGVPAVKKNLEAVMVRRLKEDLRRIGEQFPKRQVVQEDIVGLPEDAPELALSRLLDQYRTVRQQRFEGETRRKQAQAAIVISGLQQRLLSSIEAFAKTLKVHRRGMEKLWAGQQSHHAPRTDLLASAPDPDDDRSLLSEEELQELVEAQMEEATTASAGNAVESATAQERALLDQMEDIADSARGVPDPRVRRLVAWMRETLCPGARLPDEGGPVADAEWNNTRVIIFTEYDDTKRYLVRQLQLAIAGTDRAEERIAVFHGPTPLDKREAIKTAFRTEPSKHPLRILIATDAAREGLNLQTQCNQLFHFDLPWNPSRLEQRNGRIDRKLQPAPEVFCHYFVYAQRPEDRILQTLVRKTETIRTQLGSLSDVLDSRLEKMLSGGIRHDQIAALDKEMEQAGPDPDRSAVVEEELEATREREEQLRAQCDALEARIDAARKALHFDNELLADTLSCALELLGKGSLAEVERDDSDRPSFQFPDLTADPTWTETLDTLRKPPPDGKRDFKWKRESPVRPIIFHDPDTLDSDEVHLHLGHRVSQRLLSRFLSQGFIYHDLSRACLTQSRDNIPRVILLARLSIYGAGASRLHEEILTVTSRWSPPAGRSEPLKAYARDAEARTIDLLHEALRPGQQHDATPGVSSDVQASIPQDISELLPQLETVAEAAKVTAEERLAERGRIESKAIRQVLEEQKKRILRELGRCDDLQLELDLDEEKKQLEYNRRHWQKWLKGIDQELEDEPARILNYYKTYSYRVEPVGLAYLIPATN